MKLTSSENAKNGLKIFLQFKGEVVDVGHFLRSDLTKNNFFLNYLFDIISRFHDVRCAVDWVNYKCSRKETCPLQPRIQFEKSTSPQCILDPADLKLYFRYDQEFF